VIHGKASDLKDHIRQQHPDHQSVAPSQPQPSQPPEEISPWKLGGLSARELGKRVWKSVNDDNVFNRSAELAYYFFLALFPALIFLTSILGLFAAPGTAIHNRLLQYIGEAMPGSAYQLVQQILTETNKASGGGKITFGLLFTLWSATQGMVAVQDTLNAVHDVKEQRPFWKARGIALGLTVVGSALVVIALAGILGGDAIAKYVGAHWGLGPVAIWTWRIVQWPIALAFLALVFSMTYYFAPDVEQPHWEWLTPGAVAGMLTWILASVALRIYMHYFNSYSATYGSLGAVIILLTWFYVTGLMLLLGAEVNAEIENAAANRGRPDAKRKGDKVPSGQRQPAA
jgi:membrane protein